MPTTEFLAEKGDIVTHILAQAAGDLLADQGGLAFAPLGDAAFDQRDALPVEAVRCPAGGEHAVVVVGGGEGDELAGHGFHPRDSAHLGDEGLAECAAERLGDAAPPHGQIGAMLVEALLHVLLHAVGEAVKGDETADSESDAEHRQDRPRRPASEVAEGELQMIHEAASRARSGF